MKKPVIAAYIFALFLILKGIFFPDRLFNMGYVTMKAEPLYGIFIFLSAALSAAMWDRWKYNTVQFVAHGLSGSFYKGDSARVGNWFVTSLGGIDIPNFNDKGREETVIVPMPSIRYMGDNVVSNVVPKKVDLDQVPRMAKEYIEDNDLPTDNIKLGTIPARIEESNKTLPEYQKEWEDLNEIINFKESALREVMKDSNKIVEWREDVSGSKSMGKIQRKIEKLKGDEG